MNRTLAEIRAFFQADRFATERAEVTIDRADPPETPGGALVVCSMPVTPAHRNAGGGVMGGALFTLADLCFAVLNNAWSETPNTVSVSSTIRFVGPCRGARLVGTVRNDRAGRSLAFGTCRIEDDLGNLVALVDMTCYRVPCR